MTPDDVVADAYDGQGLNRYTYVDNRPLTLTDPMGHMPLGLPGVGGVGPSFYLASLSSDDAPDTSGMLHAPTSAEGAEVEIAQVVVRHGTLADSNDYSTTPSADVARILKDPKYQAWENSVRNSDAFNSSTINQRHENVAVVYVNEATHEVTEVREVGHAVWDSAAGIYRSVDPGTLPTISGSVPFLFSHGHPFPTAMTQGIQGFNQPSSGDIHYAFDHDLQGVVFSHDQSTNYFFGPPPLVEVGPALVVVTHQIHF